MLLTVLQAIYHDTTATSNVGTIILCPFPGHDGSYRLSAYNLSLTGATLTLKKLLAGILLEQRLMSHRSLEVIDHEVEDRSNLFLAVTSELSKCLILDSVSIGLIAAMF